MLATDTGLGSTLRGVTDARRPGEIRRAIKTKTLDDFGPGVELAGRAQLKRHFRRVVAPTWRLTIPEMEGPIRRPHAMNIKSGSIGQPLELAAPLHENSGCVRLS